MLCLTSGTGVVGQSKFPKLIGEECEKDGCTQTSCHDEQWITHAQQITCRVETNEGEREDHGDQDLDDLWKDYRRILREICEPVDKRHQRHGIHDPETGRRAQEFDRCIDQRTAKNQ